VEQAAVKLSLGDEVKPVEQPPRDPERLLNRRELAERLGLAERSISSMVNAGELPKPYRLGGVVRWSWREVEKYLRASQNQKPRRGRGIRRRDHGELVTELTESERQTSDSDGTSLMNT
jgi:predicted DNA-binding transcriptional regulator AlpA